MTNSFKRVSLSRFVIHFKKNTYYFQPRYISLIRLDSIYVKINIIVCTVGTVYFNKSTNHAVMIYLIKSMINLHTCFFCIAIKVYRRATCTFIFDKYRYVCLNFILFTKNQNANHYLKIVGIWVFT